MGHIPCPHMDASLTKADLSPHPCVPVAMCTGSTYVPPYLGVPVPMCPCTHQYRNAQVWGHIGRSVTDMIHVIWGQDTGQMPISHATSMLSTQISNVNNFI